jgi:pimeloyl-ACP methyl ester carboxylesterase
MRSHLDELVAAVAALAGHNFLDPKRVVGFGNSEGCLHVLHYATSEQAIPFAGVILASPPGRPMGEVLLSQLALQLGSLPVGSDLLTKVEASTRRYSAGEPMDPDPALPDAVKMILQSFEAPANLPFARELWTTKTVDLLTGVDIPALVLIGQKDLQVDARADGTPLQSATQGMPNILFAFPANANHVLKEDVRPIEAIVAAPGTGYNEPGTRLDVEAVATILSWLRRVVG